MLGHGVLTSVYLILKLSKLVQSFSIHLSTTHKTIEVFSFVLDDNVVAIVVSAEQIEE